MCLKLLDSVKYYAEGYIVYLPMYTQFLSLFLEIMENAYYVKRDENTSKTFFGIAIVKHIALMDISHQL